MEIKISLELAKKIIVALGESEAQRELRNIVAEKVVIEKYKNNKELIERIEKYKNLLKRKLNIEE